MRISDWSSDVCSSDVSSSRSGAPTPIWRRPNFFGSAAMRDVAIIGAGVIGLAAAAELQRRGRRVTLIDPAEPGRECSFGNAGIIATSEIFQIGRAHV